MAKNSLFPIIVLFTVIGILALIGFVVYSIVQDISNKTKANMEKKNIKFSKDGMKVSMKEVNDEDYKDQTQSVLVNVWNHSSFPGYKSKLWNNGATPEDKKVKKR
ncbi:uncharacterized protein TRUGW13939_03291 [Talaromyces rugulosus]|uniref:Uncharacterized protein n=1 Tax=Talaromyces rugulosus TaxID=121627 RepID=A0A7H8QRW3_TALRU|nr:uncharacterized protein TRUGW13939_03291 [Talaromyces rugulosus]QKX56191.1 hypothetical protein TRUGW13939_03291 [Talaromyces rugulosus]